MREQVATQKVGTRSGSAGSRSRSVKTTQRPSKRDRTEGQPLAVRLKNLVGYAPLLLKLSALAVVIVLAFLGYRAAASASFFQVRTVQTAGLNRSSAQAIESAVRDEVRATGVWQADLTSVSARLEKLPWIRTAVVTRVLPDGIRVRVTERQPRVVVRMSSGRLVWVDEDGVVLNELNSTDKMPSFFLRGWNEDESAAAAEENRGRIAKFIQLQKDWDAEGLSDRISEVNVQDLRDVRAQLAGDDSQIEIRLGSVDQAKRLGPALQKLDQLRQTPRGPYVSYLVNEGERIFVGVVTGGRAFADTPDTADSLPSQTDDQARKQGNKAKEKESKARTPSKKVEQKRT
ncbi:MAG TPA: FtsQ-type POTRA domain-containing protein [Pyrinomonadaceae bacterium]|nr:FtsQ-type POTRA domain-containing protein [Pyrinomonadaceae bacterium]